MAGWGKRHGNLCPAAADTAAGTVAVDNDVVVAVGVTAVGTVAAVSGVAAVDDVDVAVDGIDAVCCSC
jgi:hypothetical protein